MKEDIPSWGVLSLFAIPEECAAHISMSDTHARAMPRRRASPTYPLCGLLWEDKSPQRSVAKQLMGRGFLSHAAHHTERACNGGEYGD